MRADFVEALLDVAAHPDITSNRFVRAVAEGTCPRPILKNYASEQMALTRAFPSVLAQVFAQCDYFPARQVLLGNLLEEMGGQRFVVGKGLELDPQLQHAELSAQFARALGVTDAGQAAMDSAWLNQNLQQGLWIGPFAYLSIGFEANLPKAFAMMLPGLATHYALSEQDLRFFPLHIEADQRHSRDSAEILAHAANTEAARTQALEGAQRGARTWWHLHERHARGMRRAQSSEAC